MLAYKDIKLQSRELSSPSSLPQGCRKYGRLGAGGWLPTWTLTAKLEAFIGPQLCATYV